MFYRTGSDLEKAIFDECSDGIDLVKEFWAKPVSFGPDVRTILEKSKSTHPNIKIGAVLHHQVARQLSRHLDPKGLVFLSTVNTKVDARHQTDGLFYLPSLFPHLVTVDAYNISERDIRSLREMWEDSFLGNIYSDADFQSDLYRYKKGALEWRKKYQRFAVGDEDLFRGVINFRQYSNASRPENHFIMTPGMLGTYEARRAFAKLVAGYFVKVAGKKMA